MATRKSCARCMTPTPSTTIGSFAYENVRYEIPLCDPHAAMFDRDMVGWLRLASEIAPPKTLPLKSRVDTSTPIRFLIPKAPPREIVLDDDPEPPEAEGFSDWTMGFDLSLHARERMAERGISSAEVYRVIDSQSKTRAPGDREGTHVYRTRELKIVVDERTRSVLTAARENQNKELIS